ncbi:50S ribosomal protein L21 [Bartonella clarridgeiae 73]|uniref:Large ribosomal subunit protein bL21 n=1 Tax=Bartonella clarridgeiae (strain CCUG 45776 / CIP 104772 / 73) TaxID=696125 RepID=E6YIW8_BARC7|nr:50S ribosomal protein L21 [Bartonella clarridgeiae]WCR54629.1 MAG: LSU ribosomal protein L21p [Bartonella clarridgeiae]CBI76806.1 50S ribosomal protein L21 [Bartonella clarridgeiae 73]
MFAVIKTGGKQYHVTANQIIKVEKIIGDVGNIIELNNILMVYEGNNVTVGKPIVVDALVTAEIVEQGRARKIISFKKRRRQNSKRTRGHRQELTTLRILEVSSGGSKTQKMTEKSVNKKVGASKETKASASPSKTAKKTTERKATSKKVAPKKSESEKD